MLAQNFLTAFVLNISDAEHNALVQVLGMLERGEIPQRLFKMNMIGAPECGSAGCICGWARTIDESVFHDGWNVNVKHLFIRPQSLQQRQATPTQAAIAVRNYLTTGYTNWQEAMAA